METTWAPLAFHAIFPTSLSVMEGNILLSSSKDNECVECLPTRYAQDEIEHYAASAMHKMKPSVMHKL
jgi:hypothetical protein